jgi:hypothetical protein
MVETVMAQINNYFVYEFETGRYTIKAGNVIEGSFRNTYIPGQYIKIHGSITNDGVYKVQSMSPTQLVTQEELQPEDTPYNFYVLQLRPPKDFLQLAEEIKTYVERSGSRDGIASESIDDYSVSFSNGDGGWKSVFAKRLATYRRRPGATIFPYPY